MIELSGYTLVKESKLQSLRSDCASLNAQTVLQSKLLNEKEQMIEALRLDVNACIRELEYYKNKGLRG